MTPTVLLVRHGTTEMNDPTNERIRGYSDIPLSYEGKQIIKKTAEFLKDYPVKKVLASPLQRSIMTADLIADAHAKVYPNHGLLPWNLGDYSEQPVKEVASKMNYLQHYPDIKAPRGESYRDFYSRWSDALDKMLLYAVEYPEEIVVGVVHSRNLLALPSILGDKNIGDVPVKGGAPPGAVIAITNDGEGWNLKVIYEEKIDA